MVNLIEKVSSKEEEELLLYVKAYHLKTIKVTRIVGLSPKERTVTYFSLNTFFGSPIKASLMRCVS